MLAPNSKSKKVEKQHKRLARSLARSGSAAGARVGARLISPGPGPGRVDVEAKAVKAKALARRGRARIPNVITDTRSALDTKEFQALALFHQDQSKCSPCNILVRALRRLATIQGCIQ